MSRDMSRDIAGQAGHFGKMDISCTLFHIVVID